MMVYFQYHHIYTILFKTDQWSCSSPTTDFNEEKQAEEEEKFLLAPMGVLAPGSAHGRPSAQPPIDTSGIFWAHMSAE